ncbi:hypothetical protein PENTCL1PPCAC_12702, partial [Pristionchus entomophagus]
LSDGDVLIHAGDITVYGDTHNLTKFNEELGRLPHPHKLVIAGNHELGFDPNEDQCLRWDVNDIVRTSDSFFPVMRSRICLIKNIIHIDGVKFYGSSWHPLSGFPFYQPRGQLKQKWENIPDNTDVLITHSPPI